MGSGGINSHGVCVEILDDQGCTKVCHTIDAAVIYSMPLTGHCSHSASLAARLALEAGLRKRLQRTELYASYFPE